jgi:hypothetical protein
VPPLTLPKISYEKLNSKQKEAYNFQKVSAILADFGVITIPLNNDWNGADFIAQMYDGKDFRKVQLKSRLTFASKYRGQELYICFRDGNDDDACWYIYDHDELLNKLPGTDKMQVSKTWESKPYHFPYLSEPLKELLEPYRIHPSDRVILSEA